VESAGSLPLVRTEQAGRIKEIEKGLHPSIASFVSPLQAAGAA
jgi:hypothetical protein